MKKGITVRDPADIFTRMAPSLMILCCYSKGLYYRRHYNNDCYYPDPAAKGWGMDIRASVDKNNTPFNWNTQQSAGC